MLVRKKVRFHSTKNKRRFGRELLFIKQGTKYGSIKTAPRLFLDRANKIKYAQKYHFWQYFQYTDFIPHLLRIYFFLNRTKKDRKFCQKSQFWSKIKTLPKSQGYCEKYYFFYQKSKFLEKIKTLSSKICLAKIKTLTKSGVFCRVFSKIAFFQDIILYKKSRQFNFCFQILVGLFFGKKI